MRRTTLALFAVLASLTMAAPTYADNQYRDSGPPHADNQYRHPQVSQADHQRRGPGRSRANNRRRDHGRSRADNRYQGYRGYRERPYNRQRHYDRYRHDNRNYGYRGHWRSWNDWEAYRMRYHARFRDGRYYRQNGHLMFRFCDPQSGSCAFFSIGR